MATFNPSTSPSAHYTLFPTSCFSCVSLSPDYPTNINRKVTFCSVAQFAAVLFFQFLLVHTPFQLVGNVIAYELQRQGALKVPDGIPFYGIDPILRASVTIADTLKIIFMILVGYHYKKHVSEKRGTRGFLYNKDRPLNQNLIDYQSIDPLSSIKNNTKESKYYDICGGVEILNDERPLFPREWLWVVVWSTLANPIRMGDTFHAAGVFESFWTPLRLYAVSRVAALAIGLIPNLVGGVPSSTTSLMLGLIFAAQREKFERNVEKLNGGNVDASVHQRNSGWTYRMRNVLGYAYFGCFMVIWDAHILDDVEEVKMKGFLSVSVGKSMASGE